MITLSIKNVPDALAEKLRARAERNHRSLQGELLAILEASTAEDDLPAGTMMRGHLPIRQLMEKVAAYGLATPSESADIVREGREGHYGDRDPRVRG